MTSDDIRAQVNRAIAEEFELDATSFTPEMTLIEDLGLDSLDSVDLIAALERSFRVKCPEVDARAVRTIGDIYGLIERLQAAKP